MTKCNRKKQLLGKSIRNVRMRRFFQRLGVDEPDDPEPDDLLSSKRGIRVRCVETGVVYKTITQAAKETGASQAGIRGAASGMAGGYRWEYVDD